MQIQLKQHEIETALKLFVVEQGISLAGRDVEISFTAGRNGAGISADIDIGDVHAPISVGNVRSAGCCAKLASAPNGPIDTYPLKDTVQVQEPIQALPEIPQEVQAEAQPEDSKPVTSLFGS